MPPEDELSAYLAVRKASRNLVAQLTRTLSGAAMQEAGRKLGLLSTDPNLKRPLFVFGSEQEMAILSDYAIFNCRDGGRNAVEKFMANAPPPTGSLERTILEGMLRARYSLFAVERITGAVGVEMKDLWRGDTVRLADRGFHDTAPRGLCLATRIIPLPQFAITGGAALPLTIADAGDVERALTPLLGRNFQGRLHTLTSAKEANMVALVIRKLLAQGATEHIRYDMPKGTGADEQKPV